MSEEKHDDLATQFKQLTSKPNANEMLAEKLSRDWLWLQQLVTPSDSKMLRETISSSRAAVQGAITNVQGAALRADVAVTSITTPPEAVQGSSTPAEPIHLCLCGMMLGLALAREIGVRPAVRETAADSGRVDCGGGAAVTPKHCA
jgi:hypothetical protein